MSIALRTATIGAACVLSACAAMTGEAVKDASYSLAEQQSIALTRSATLRYDGANDSRCPQRVVCVWAGAIDYRFTLRTRRGAESFTLGARQPSFTSVALNGASFALGALQPPPARGATEAPPSHPVTLIVTAP